MRMINVNILNTEKTLQQAIENGSKKYFCVSTDKAANPVTMMGASKRIMESFLMRKSLDIEVSTARFANVAFSDGSLLYGFNQRIIKRQALVAPTDVKRYFVIAKEAGELCLMSCLLAENRDVFFPKLSENLHLISFSEIAVRYLSNLGYKPYICENEDEARSNVESFIAKNKWPCLFSESNTTGEKDFEEFFTHSENLDMDRFNGLGIIKNDPEYDNDKLEYFTKTIEQLKFQKSWNKDELVDLFHHMIPDFGHKETGKYLDSKM